ncbi:MAG TPA: hypothetical protein VFZ16_02970 [Hyphomicrobiaceae bacterium]|nr:hypothetical protein [Hyphomicrobiaceae bacterium]
MMPASDLRTLTSHDSDARKALTSAFEALDKWREELITINERHLTKTLDLVASSQRSLGLPDHFTTATRDYLLKASKIQTQMIGQVIDAWEKQLKSSAYPGALPEAFQFQMPGPPRSTSRDPGPDTLPLRELAMAAPLTPFMLWMQAAEMWQRSWAQAMTGSFEPRQERASRRTAH